MTKTTKRTARNNAETTTSEELTMNMQTAHTGEIDLSADDAILASMLEGIEDDAADLNADDAGLVDLNDEDAIEAAIADIEKAEAVQEHYAEEGEPEAAEAAADKPKKEKKAKAPKAPKEPKEPKAPRITYVGHKASDVLQARLGGKANEMLILEAEDALLDPAALEAKQSELLALLNKRPGTGEGGSTQKKVAEKVVMLFGWLKNGGKLNEVMLRTFTVLAKDGHLTSGDKGNLHAELLAKPYSVGTARAQAGQMFAMLPMLKVVSKEEKGRYTLNPNSMIFDAVKAQLSL